MTTKRKKKNKSLGLVVLLAILLSLLAAYWLIKNLSNEEVVDDGTEDNSISLVEYAEDDIVSFGYSYDDVVRKFELSNGVWKLSDDTDFPLDETVVSNMLAKLSSITAKMEIDAGEYSEYGLDTPALVLNVVTSDGTEYTYSIGDLNSFNDLTYILFEEKVYMFDDTLSAVFDATLDEIILIEDTFPTAITVDSVSSITLSDENSVQNVFEGDSVEGLLSLIKEAFTFETWKDYSLEESELAEYGISDAAASIAISYKMSVSDDSEENDATVDALFTLYCHKTAEEESYYALKGSDMVFSVDSDELDEIFGYTYEPETD